MRTILAVLAAWCVGASTAAAQSSTGPLSLTQAMAAVAAASTSAARPTDPSVSRFSS